MLSLNRQAVLGASLVGKGTAFSSKTRKEKANLRFCMFSSDLFFCGFRLTFLRKFWFFFLFFSLPPEIAFVLQFFFVSVRKFS